MNSEASTSRLDDPQDEEQQQNESVDNVDDVPEGMDPEGFSGPTEKFVKPLTREALAAFQAAQNLRHLMSGYGEVGRVYLQQGGITDPKRAYLPHFTEGWVEFKDKKVARSVAEMLKTPNRSAVRKGTRWRDDVWTMKYLPKFKWSMLTEQVAHEAAAHTAKLRVELSQSRSEQRDYLKNVEHARVLDKRAEKKREKGEVMELKERPRKRKRSSDDDVSEERTAKKPPIEDSSLREKQLRTVLNRYTRDCGFPSIDERKERIDAA
ncbi:Pre-rRNA-processing protein ESF2 [Favolaschia claudopus]|uniref:Pre-rRNA-processing protein ESF2 n=1 Tax=Favolaschia claudopus TaxID=2862362 RepID=A0AAW0ECQ8_9AGAR